MHSFGEVNSNYEYCLEIAQSHDGSLGYVNAILRSLSARGIRLVKFQMHIPEFESTLDEPFRVELIGQDASRYDYWKRTGFTTTQWRMISEWCKSLDIEFLCTPLSCEAVDELDAMGVKRFKVASGDATNWQLIDYLITKGKPLIVSTGLSTDAEIETLVDRFPETFPLTLLYCVSKYPASEGDINFSRMRLLKSKYPSLKIGYSDHTGNPLIAIAAYHFGANFVEQHVVFSKEQYGPDTSSSVDIDQAEGVQSYSTLLYNLDRSAGSFLEESNIDSLGTKKVFSRGLALRASLKKGDLLLEDNVTMKKPSGPLSWDDKALIIGKKAARDLDSGYHLNFKDFE
jgi:N,N'-diacetyllegionaminate synthase